MPGPRIAGPGWGTGGPTWLAGHRKVEEIGVYAVMCVADESVSHGCGINPW
jgi:hypothetical protein